MEIKRTNFKLRTGDMKCVSITLSDWCTATHTEYATHMVDKNGKYWGHYLSSKKDAEHDYASRIKKQQHNGFIIDTQWGLDDNIDVVSTVGVSNDHQNYIK